MAKYIYSALKTNNQIVKGEIEALNPREAREKIRELGFIPTKVYTETALAAPMPQEHSDNADVQYREVTHLFPFLKHCSL